MRVEIVLTYNPRFQRDCDPDMSVQFRYGAAISHELHVAECDSLSILETLRSYVDRTALHEIGDDGEWQKTGENDSLD